MTKVGKAVPWRLEDTGRQTANLLWSVTLITHGARLAALPWMERLSPVEWAANVELVWNVGFLALVLLLGCMVRRGRLYWTFALELITVTEFALATVWLLYIYSTEPIRAIAAGALILTFAMKAWVVRWVHRMIAVIRREQQRAQDQEPDKPPLEVVSLAETDATGS